MAPDTMTPTATAPVFLSKTKGLRLRRFQAQTNVSAIGTQVQVSPGWGVEFSDGFLTVDDALRESFERFVSQYGALYGAGEHESVEEWLRGHRNFRFQGPGGFVEVPRPVPSSDPVLQEITAAAVDGDEERIAQLYVDERDGFDRPDVLAAATGALDRMAAKRAPTEPVGASEDG